MLHLVTQLCPALCDPWTVAHQAPLSMGILQARILEWVAFPFSRGSSQPRDRPRSPTLQVDSLWSEPPGKPKGNHRQDEKTTLRMGEMSANEATDTGLISKM